MSKQPIGIRENQKSDKQNIRLNYVEEFGKTPVVTSNPHLKGLEDVIYLEA